MRQTGQFTRIDEPAVEPLSVAQAKQHCRAEHSVEDAVFERLISAARRFVENDCGLALIDQTWEARFDGWDDRGLRLRPHPVAMVDGIKVWGGTSFTTLALSDFDFLPGRPALLVPKLSYTPPPPQRARQGVLVTFTSGFGAADTDVPAEIAQAMLQLVAHWFENREPTAVADNLSVVADIKFTVRDLLSPWRSLRLG